MSNYQEGNRITKPSGYDFTGDSEFNQYLIVKLSTGKVVKSSAATDKHIGVLMNNPTDSGEAEIKPLNASGTGKVTAGGSINADDYITSDSNGKAVATTTLADNVIGQALEAASSGQVFEYMPYPFKYGTYA